MKRQNILIVFMLFVISHVLYSEMSKRYTDINLGYSYIEISTDKFYFNDIAGHGAPGYRYPSEIIIEPAIIKKISSVPFVFDAKGNKRALLLYNDDFMLMYYKDKGWDTNRRFLAAASKKIDIREVFSPEKNIIASSYLIERNTKYPPANFERIRLTEPWVEGVKGQGIGEWIEFSLQSVYGEVKASALYLVNGFVSWDKPELYEYNSRVKRLKVTDITTNESWFVDLEDTPCPQYIDFTSRETHRIRFTIEAVYPGTKYEDTCIGGIILLKR